MSDRRTSSRARKQVDYSVSGEKDFDGDNDDDFAISSRGPAVKKLRTAKEKVTEKCNLINPKQASSSKSNDKTSKERRPLDDRLFERDLELVMSISKPASDLKGSHIEAVSVSSQLSNAANSIEAKDLQNTADKETKSMQLESSFMEVIQHEKEEVASMQKMNLDLSNNDALLSDHLSLSDAESSADDDESDSSSSSDTYQGRRVKTKAQSKRSTKAKPEKPTKSAKQTLDMSNNSKIIKPVSPASSSQKSIARSNLPTASGGHSNVISNKQSSYSSPTSGVLRIGLSRNVKVKPLHQLCSPTLNFTKS